MMNFLVKRLHPDAKLPVKGSEEAACFDLHVLNAVLDPNGWTVHTGIAIALPPGYGMLVYPRSGLSTNYGLTLRNGTGVIDSDYRGEIIVKLNHGYPHSLAERTKALDPGSRIAQAMIIQIPDMQPLEVEELPTTLRGAGGFGSTGV